jgi:hypothetical protein
MDGGNLFEKINIVFSVAITVIGWRTKNPSSSFSSSSSSSSSSVSASFFSSSPFLSLCASARLSFSFALHAFSLYVIEIITHIGETQTFSHAYRLHLHIRGKLSLQKYHQKRCNSRCNPLPSCMTLNSTYSSRRCR